MEGSKPTEDMTPGVVVVDRPAPTVQSCKEEIDMLLNVIRRRKHDAQTTEDITSDDVIDRQTPSLKIHLDQVQSRSDDILTINAAKAAEAKPTEDTSSGVVVTFKKVIQLLRKELEIMNIAKFSDYEPAESLISLEEVSNSKDTEGEVDEIVALLEKETYHTALPSSGILSGNLDSTEYEYGPAVCVKKVIQLLQEEVEIMSIAKFSDAEPVESIISLEEVTDRGDKEGVVTLTEDEIVALWEKDLYQTVLLSSGILTENLKSTEYENVRGVTVNSLKDKVVADNKLLPEDRGTIQIISDALPRIVDNALFNHREKLYPLFMYAIEHHPDSYTRDSLTHTFFNLIERPNEHQRNKIMDLWVILARKVGEMRTETELLPQFWKQANHIYTENRLLAARSCWELANYVRPEFRDSLILSTLQRLMEDCAVVVREAAVCYLSWLLPLFPNTDRYLKVEEVMFQLLKDPSHVVLQTSITKLLPALLKWGKQWQHLLDMLLSNILSSIESCPLASEVEDSVESRFHVLGVRERQTVDVLLQLLLRLIPLIHQTTFKSCPYPSVLDHVGLSYPLPLLEKYREEPRVWRMFEWLHNNCFPCLIHIASLLPHEEDILRSQISSFLLEVSKRFGDDYVTHIMLPVFLVAVGDDADLSFFPSFTCSRVKALRPKTALYGRIASACVLPVLLGGVLGSYSKIEALREYLRNLIVQSVEQDDQSTMRNAGVYNSIRCLCLFKDQHDLAFDVLVELLNSSNMEINILAAKLMKLTVPNADANFALESILPALVTLSSQTNLHLLCASIDALGTVAQYFKTDEIVEIIQVQLDSFIEDRSHKTMVAAIRALVAAVPHTTDGLRDYLLSNIYLLSAASLPSSNMVQCRDRSNAFCEAVRALDASDLSDASVNDMLLPTIENILKDRDALDPAHKEALEIIVKKRTPESRGILKYVTKVMDPIIRKGGIMDRGKQWRHLSHLSDRKSTSKKLLTASA